MMPLIVGGDSFDLVLRGGRVIDPASRMDRVADVAIRGGKIAAIGSDLRGREVIEAGGKIVVPGLIDLHTHLADPGLSVADLSRIGVTAALDGGSRGADNIDDFAAAARKSAGRVRILLNISRIGLTKPAELSDLENADTALARRAIEKHRDVIVGIKARLSRSAAGEHDRQALQRALEAARPLKIPVMSHINDTATPLVDLLRMLRRGDIVTHMYAPENGILDASGRVLAGVIEARRRGVLFDFGNGRTAHWNWDVATKAINQGFLPDTISSDITAPGMEGQVVNLPHVMSKFLLLGLSLPDVVSRVTIGPARALSCFRDLGTLRTGARADVSVLELKRGEVSFVDNYKTTRVGTQVLLPAGVLIAGQRIS
jgi:dihydroorotase